MREAAVMEHLIEFLDRPGYVYFVDPGETAEYDDVREQCEQHDHCGLNETITIGTRIPDIIGFTPNRDIFAIEVKGEADIRKGIGQAAYYRRGVHRSYLAAETTALAEFRETALASGVGTFEVDPDGSVTRTDPAPEVAATRLRSTRQALALRTTQFESAHTTFPPMVRPDNAFIPVLAIGAHDAATLSREGYQSVIESADPEYSHADNALRLARTLQLVETENSGGDTDLSLTDHGALAYTFLQGKAVEVGGEPPVTVAFSDTLKLRSEQRLLHQAYRDAAALLRDRYLSVPDVRLLVRILASQDRSALPVSRVLAEVALESPNTFLNLFCASQTSFRQLVEGESHTPDDESFQAALLQMAAVSYLYNFTSQLQHIGILTTQTDKTDTRSELAVGEQTWDWDPKMVGQLGVDTL